MEPSRHPTVNKSFLIVMTQNTERETKAEGYFRNMKLIRKGRHWCDITDTEIRRIENIT